MGTSVLLVRPAEYVPQVRVRLTDGRYSPAFGGEGGIMINGEGLNVAKNSASHPNNGLAALEVRRSDGSGWVQVWP
ncbi:hypothetical protein [Deinococcus sp. YIM 77859]|nr:hypothetical protein [Deinococcus sp. YIM 77859]